jgi:aryl-alcohol dehydrogenase-like predicted oxidoreductase
MEYAILGNSQLKISRIGFGCMSLNAGDETSKHIIETAIEKGINFFDTADLYDHGDNEIMLGKVLQQKRKDVIIATKVGNQWRKDGSGWDWNPTKQYILASVEESLRRLNTDYIDLYQLHGGTIQDPIDETIEAFETLLKQGKIRYYGISSIRPNVISEYVRRSHIVSVMMQYSLLDRRPEETCFPLLKEHNIGVLVRGSLAKGLLVNKPATGYLNYKTSEVATAAKAVQALTIQGREATQTALQFVLQQPAVTSSVVGIRTLEQLDGAVKTIGTAPLTDTELEKLRNSIPINRYEDHRN